MALTRPRYSQIYDTDYKQSVKVATTADVGNLLAGGNMTDTVDNISLAVLDRILVKDQSDATQNGIYRVITLGTGSNGTWERTLDASTGDRMTSGMTTIVERGDTNANKTFRLTTADPITVGTTELTFVDPFVVTASAAGANTEIQFSDTGGVIGASSDLTFDKATQVLTVNGTTNTDDLTISGNVTGNLVPSANVTYSLGSESLWWKDLFLSGNTIYIGGQTASVDTSGVWSFTSGSANVVLGPTSEVPGNITVAGVMSQGTSQYVTNQYVLHGTTTDNTETEIFVNNVENYRIPVTNNTTISYQVDIVARRTDATGESASWHLKGVADNFSGTTDDVGDIYEIIIADDDGNLVVDARADDTNDSINIYVTGVSSKDYRWVAMVKTIEVLQ